MRVLTVFLLALSWRLLHFFEFRDALLFQNPILDSNFYFLWAQEIVKGPWVGREVFVLNPGYAYFLAVLFRLLQPGVTVPVLFQCVLGASSCALIYWTGAALFDKRTAMVAAVLAALYPVSVLYDGLLVTASIVLFLNAAAIHLLLTSKIRWQAIIPGALIGISALFRPTVLAFVPFVLAWLAMKKRRDFMIFFTAGLAVVLLPVLARNYVMGRQFVIASAGIGMNFYIGNNPQAVGTYQPLPFESGDPRLQVEEFRQEASRISGRILTNAEASRFWLVRAARFIAQQPLQFLTLTVKKAALFVNRAEIPTNMDVGYLKSTSFLRYFPLSFGILFPLALFGMMTTTGVETRLLTFYVVAYFFTNLLFFVGSEYRYPVVPALFIFCAAAISHLARARSLQGLGFPVLVSGVFLVVSNLNLYQNETAVLHNNLGNIHMRQGRPDAAVAEYRKAMEIDPRNVPARANLAVAHFNRRAYVPAIVELHRILEINPSFADAWYYLGLSHYYLGNYKEALPYFKKALELKPDWKEARTFLDLAQERTR